MLIVLLWLKKLNQVIKLLNLKSVKESDLLSTKVYLVKFALKIGQKKYLLFIASWKLILGHIKLKIETKKKIIESFYEKESL